MCCAGVGAAHDVDLRERAEAARSADADFESALHFALDLALDRQSGLPRVFELFVGHSPAREPA
ncbi:MAG: hypothetical protein QM736_15050 [Vicinamibacterales bacterium]